ncbi:hypothetical protein OQA88_9718 [Cercophora sp. LCS_1]
MAHTPATFVLLLFLLSISAIAKIDYFIDGWDAVHLEEVEALTFRADKQTTSRGHVDPVPQLKCISNPLFCALSPVDALHCINNGSPDYVDWNCTAAAVLPSVVRLASTNVTCQGRSSPNNTYVLKGSCRAEYQLGLSVQGKDHLTNWVGKQKARTRTSTTTHQRTISRKKKDGIGHGAAKEHGESPIKLVIRRSFDLLDLAIYGLFSFLMLTVGCLTLVLCLSIWGEYSVPIARAFVEAYVQFEILRFGPRGVRQESGYF